MSDPAPDPTTDVPPPDQHLDIDAEQARLDDLGERIHETDAKAHADLDIGGSGRTFTDEGVARQVEDHGDTQHHRAD